MKYIKYVRDKFSTADFPVFTLPDLKVALKDRSIGKDYLYVMVHNLMRRKEITKISKGTYTFHSDAVVVGFAFRPFYYGLENALAIRGISDQGTNFVVVTPRNVRIGIRSFNGRNYRVSHISSKLFFGYELVKYSGFWVPVSDLEKTVIDMVYYKAGIRAELLPEIKKRINQGRLYEYLRRYKPYLKHRVYRELKISEFIGITDKLHEGIGKKEAKYGKITDREISRTVQKHRHAQP